MLVGLDKGAADRNGCTAKIATGAVVLVSDRFLISHAFLKDSAVQVKACMLTAAGKVVRSCVDDALRLAGVEAGQIQLLESQGFTPTAEKNRLSRDVDVKQISKPLAPLKDLSTTGLAGLCGLVWRLRGWIPEQNTGLQNCLQHTSSYEGQAVTVVLSRSDGQAAPKYQDI